MTYLFEYTDYKSYLKAVEGDRSTIQKGFRTRLSEALGCQNAYISQVLNTHADFSPEHGLKIADFLLLNEAETKYFILLIEHARAGTTGLKSFFKKDINSLREKHLNIKDRVPEAKNLTLESQNIYYSSWVYPAIHMLITIPQYRNIKDISAALRISENTTREVILFLISNGLILEKKGTFIPGPTQLHLEKTSPHIRQHHSSWRVSAIQSLASPEAEGIHYSTVSSLSFNDVERLKTKFVQMIQEYVEIVKPSKEETLYNFNLDFYEIIKK